MLRTATRASAVALAIVATTPAGVATAQEQVDHSIAKGLVSQRDKGQADDGSWTNSNRQWLEDDPNLASAFALIALSYCQADGAAP